MKDTYIEILKAMEPYSLRWWLNVQSYYWESACDAYYRCEQIEALEYINKANWINDRLIKQYD